MSIDLVILVPDKNIEQAIVGLLSRYHSIGIKRVDHQIIVHPERDPGIYHTGYALLEPFAGNAKFALVLLDFAWDGRPTNVALKIVEHVESSCQSKWGDRARCICIVPEIENWIWSDSPHVAAELGWEDLTELKTWLNDKGLWANTDEKPADPKAAFRQATKQKKIVPSSSIFRELAGKVSIKRCRDESFNSLLTILRHWFSLESN